MTISEILPNPQGKDAQGEWIELRNNSDTAQSLKGWSLQDASGKKFIFKSETLQAGEFRVLKYSESKISLNNANETVTLRDPQNRPADIFSYKEAVSDGVALMRDSQGSIVRTSHPTPGAENDYVMVAAPSPDAFSRAQDSYFVASPVAQSAQRLDASSTVLREATSPSGVIVAGVVISLVLAAVFMRFFKVLSDSDNAPRSGGVDGSPEI